MKNSLRFTMIAAAIASTLSTVGCTSSSDPLRDHPKSAAAIPVDQVPVSNEPQQVVRYVDREVPVEKPVYIYKEEKQDFASAQLYQIASDKPLSFVAGVEASYDLEVKLLQAQGQFSIQGQELPEGATLKLKSADKTRALYTLTYKPANNALPGKTLEQTKNLKLVLNLQNITKLNDVSDDKWKQVKASYDLVSKEKSFSYTVRRNQNNPTVKVIGFEKAYTAGSVVKFQIEVTAPGTYNGFEPSLYVFYDFKGVGEKVYEENGSLYVNQEAGRQQPQMVSEGVWRYFYELDFKNKPILQQRDRSGKIIPDSKVLNLRVSFKAVSPAGTSSDEQIRQFEVRSETTAAAPAAGVQ